jgi:UPF0755 protein
MAKSIVRILLALLLLMAALAWYFFFSDTTGFSEKSKYFYIRTNQNDRATILQNLEKEGIVKNIKAFDLLAKQRGYYQKAKPGKYKIEKGSSVVGVLKKLSGLQEEVKLVIGKMRSREELAQKMARYFETDSTQIMQFLQNKDSLAALGVEADTWMTLFIQNTYNFYWTTEPGTVFRKLQAEKEKWWNKNDRLQAAKNLGFTPDEIFTIASIVEEETNMLDDKPIVASVYMNRLKMGMPLQADPTVRFGLKDFESNRVTYAQLRSPSPYNTYLNKGLPPGPICTPSINTIDAVLKAPATTYLYFVAKPDFSGYSIFNSNYSDHSKAAKEYQDSLGAWLKRKAAKEQTSTK